LVIAEARDMARDTKLLEQIQEAALDQDASVADALRRCIVLGGQSGSAALRDWAGQELEGYQGDVAVPDYRTVVAPILIDGISGHNLVKREQISSTDLPDVAQEAGISETLTLRQPIGSLEELARRGADRDEGYVRLGIPRDALLAKLMTSRLAGGKVVERIYWGVSPSTLFSVVDLVRNKLVRFVAELRSEAGDERAPTADEVTNAMNFAVYGGKPRFTVNAAQSATGGTSTIGQPADRERERPWWKTTKVLWGFAAGVASIIGAVIAWIQLR
jgi:hypothetical protein